MPELPEVETYRKYIEEGIFDNPVQEVILLRKKILKTDQEYFENKLIGQKFISTKRVGKYLFLETESKEWVLFHFGMTGRVEFFTDEATMPKFTRLYLTFASGLKLAFVCMRLFGKVIWIENLRDYLMQHKIGVDALEVSKSVFINYIKSRKSAIKTVLLHQKAFAGIGNWIADEILFQIKLHPEVKANQLSKEQLEALYKMTKHVLEIAVQKEANYKRFPDYFMVPHRWGDGNCPDCGEELTRIVVGGRGTYLCERKQILS